MTSSLTVLAWAGWQVRMPADWRPLRITGGWDQGELIVGNAHTSLAQFGWQRPASRRFDAARWMARRRKQVFAEDDAAPAEPENGDFSPAMQCQHLPAPRGREKGRTVWCGYAPRANLIVECRVGADIEPTRYRVLLRTVLRSLRAVARDQPTPWAVFDTSFRSPPGFVCTGSHLFAGDIGLRLTSDNGRRLTLRQLYPADLALSRYGLAEWLDHPLFDSRLVFKPGDAGQNRTFDLPNGGAGPGVLRTGRRVLRRPFSAVTRRHVVQVAVHDLTRGRLLLAEEDARDPVTEATCLNAVREMGACRETD